MNLATRSDLLRKPLRRLKTVNLPASGQTVQIQSLTEREKAAFEGDTMSRSGGVHRERLLNARLRLMILVCVDGSGNRLFTDDDLPALREIDSADSAAIFNVAQEHCGFGKTDMEELVGNSVAIAGDSSPAD